MRCRVPCPAWPPGCPPAPSGPGGFGLGSAPPKPLPSARRSVGEGARAPLPFSSTPALAVSRALCWDTPVTCWPRGGARPYPGCRWAGCQFGGWPLPRGPQGPSSHARCPAAPGAGSPGPLHLLLALLPLGAEQSLGVHQSLGTALFSSPSSRGRPRLTDASAPLPEKARSWRTWPACTPPAVLLMA